MLGDLPLTTAQPQPILPVDLPACQCDNGCGQLPRLNENPPTLRDVVPPRSVPQPSAAWPRGLHIRPPCPLSTVEIIHTMLPLGACGPFCFTLPAHDRLHADVAPYWTAWSSAVFSHGTLPFRARTIRPPELRLLHRCILIRQADELTFPRGLPSPRCSCSLAYPSARLVFSSWITLLPADAAGPAVRQGKALPAVRLLPPRLPHVSANERASSTPRRWAGQKKSVPVTLSQRSVQTHQTALNYR
eukprot:EG_transcript_10324